LVIYRARYYDPDTGEFISRDPLEYVDGMSLYRGYFAANGVDPFGTAKCPPKCRKEDWIELNIHQRLLFGALDKIGRDVKVANKIWAACCIKFKVTSKAELDLDDTLKITHSFGDVDPRFLPGEFFDIDGKKVDIAFDVTGGYAAREAYAYHRVLGYGDFDAIPDEADILIYYAYTVRAQREHIAGYTGLQFSHFVLPGVKIPGAAIASPGAIDGVPVPEVRPGSGAAIGAPRVLAHELGHVLSLEHVEDPKNLMVSAVELGDRLTVEQCTKARAAAKAIKASKTR
jgi:hypothetical protein